MVRVLQNFYTTHLIDRKLYTNGVKEKPFFDFTSSLKSAFKKALRDTLPIHINGHYSFFFFLNSVFVRDNDDKTIICCFVREMFNLNFEDTDNLSLWHSELAHVSKRFLIE